MECTQRLDRSQGLNGTQTENTSPQQIGFLGICGKKYPIIKGPNKIGRHKETCQIAISSGTISRQHAVINVLSDDNIIIMDLDSANKTMLSGRTLEPYISQPLHNCDTIQFGDVLGIFRLLKEEVDLPMTQALDVPDTPVPMRHVSRINDIKTVPESPDVSDKDDSYIIPSQPKGPQFPSPKTCNFIKPGKTISIQPIGTNKIDNIYWNSSKKSTSLNLDDSKEMFYDDGKSAVELSEQQTKTSSDIHELETQMFTVPAVKLNEKQNKTPNDIYELETQMFLSQKLEEESTDSIYTANTQLPKFDSPASIHTINTQMPSGISPPSIQARYGSSQSVHSAETQLPDVSGSASIHDLNTQIPGDNLPGVCKITEQQDVQFDLCAEKRESVANAESPLCPVKKEKVPFNSRNKNNSNVNIKSDALNTSHDEILFEELEQPLVEFESQAILTEDIELPINRLLEPDSEPLSQIVKPKSAKRIMRIQSNELDKSDKVLDISDEPLSQIVKCKSAKRNMRIKSEDSQDDVIKPAQNIIEKKVDDDDDTDCEEDNMIVLNSAQKLTTENLDNEKDMPTQVIVNNESSVVINNVDFEDLPTQVLDVDINEKDVITEKENTNVDLDFEDLPTQVLDEDESIKKKTLYSKEIIMKDKNSPFKIPSNTLLKSKKKEGSRTPKIKPISFIGNTFSNNKDNKYYQNTQDIFNDLCTQKNEIYCVTEVSIDKEKSCKKLVSGAPFTDVDAREKTDNSVRNPTNRKSSEIIDDDNQVAQVHKVPSDGSNASDVDSTPTKQRSFKFTEIDLPDSQEIKKSVSLTTRAVNTESSSESETDTNSEDQYTPIVFRKKNRSTKPNVKLDLTKKFDLETLPTRVITRVRTPSLKVQEQNKKATEIQKPKFLTEQDCDIDKEIITENISRLKSTIDKTKVAKSEEPNKVIKSEIAENKATMLEKIILRCRNKAEEKALKSEKELEKEKDSVDETKNEKTKRLPRNIKNNLVSKKQTSTSEVEVKYKPHVNKSKVETKRSTRSRNAKTANTTEKSPQKESQTEKPKRKHTRSPETESQTDKPIRKYTRKAAKADLKREENKEPSQDKEIRRSKRQKPVKEETKKDTLKSILKKSETGSSDESTVYNITSTSNMGSYRNKRPNLDDSEAPSPKRTRSAANNNTSRSTPAQATETQYVLFTAFPLAGVKTKLESMGAVIVTDVLKCTVLLTQEVKRTFKLLCAAGLGRPIVGPAWVQACMDHNYIVDPWQYLIKDEVAEKRFFFSLESTLKGKRNFLKGYNVSATPSVMPKAHEMKMIVECSGGSWQEGGSPWAVVSVASDSALWPELRRRGAALVSSEFILGGVLRQRADLELNRLK